jgi:type II secretory pathway pseudopilin PulG
MTLVELLVVIMVLVVLMGIIVVGLGGFASPSRAKATQLTMEMLKSIQAEYEAQTRRGLPHAGVLEAPHIVTEPGARELPADRDEWGRYGNAVVQTQRVLRQLLTVPASRDAYRRLPADQQMQVPWASGVSYMAGDEIAVTYAAGNRRFFRCTRDHVSGTTPGSDWSEVAEHQTVPLDGWHNPILFVPSGGLLMINRSGDPYRNSAPPVVSPGPQRPFWASAGADGKIRNMWIQMPTVEEQNKQIFLGVQDNIYSFEN